MHPRLFSKILTGLDTAPLLARISANAHLWDQITGRQDHPASPHKDTQCIFVRWAKSLSVEACFTDLEAVDMSAYNELPEVDMLITTALHAVDAKKLGRVIITKMRPGGLIEPHADEGIYADTYERFHIPLISDQGNMFTCQWNASHYESAHMHPGDLWTFNHKRIHHAYNGSRADRIHLIIDAIAPKYKRDRDEH